jgi:gluconolactonase
VNTILDTGAARVFYDGLLTDPRLDHPEGLAVHRDGSVWCGGERGQIYRITANGSSIEQVTSTDGFCLGMAFDSEDNLFVCDLKHAAVMKLDARSEKLERFADGVDGHALRIPNFPAFDAEGRMYVSDSHIFKGTITRLREALLSLFPAWSGH